MSINLQKGQKVDLTKGNTGLNQLIVGLGWDAAKSQNTAKGFFASLLGGGNQSQVDCDASVILLDANNKLLNGTENVVYFGNLTHASGSVIHKGDNLTGDGDGDDEQIIVDLKKIPDHIQHILFVVNIYDCINRKQDFGLIQNAFIRIVNAGNNQEVVKFNITENFSGKTALIAGEVYRNGSEWKFAAVGEGTNDSSLKDIIQRYV